jgi:hypothetical protein
MKRVLALALVACSPKEPAFVPVPENALPVPPISVAPTAPRESKSLLLLGDVPDAKSWTDTEVVNRLAADCHWRPTDPKDVDDHRSREPLSCHLPIHEVGMLSPCDRDSNEECKPACNEDCNRCTGKCTGECESCKLACKDEACRRSCGERCGKCRQACVVAVDQCETTVCAAGVAACETENAADLAKPACKVECGRASKCQSACTDFIHRRSPTCVDVCRKRVADACNDRLFDYCVESGGK